MTLRESWIVATFFDAYYVSYRFSTYDQLNVRGCVRLYTAGAVLLLAHMDHMYMHDFNLSREGSRRACEGWTHLRGGSGSVTLSRCVRQARYGIPELEERSASAPQVSMRRKYKTGNCACGPKGAVRCDGFEQSTRDEGKKDIAILYLIPPIALGVRTANEGSRDMGAAEYCSNW
eukprot:6185075-Pleurochrysis_carterae.AAC.1